MKKSRIFLAALSISLAAVFSASAASAGVSRMMNPLIAVKKNGSSAYKAGYTPVQIKKAYGIDKITKDGSGQLIAIVDAYGSPSIAQDLAAFDKQFGLPGADLTVYNMNKKKGANAGWALETSLDVEWAHAIAPGAKILLVEAASASTTDLLAAVDYANQKGAQVVSMSWGGAESSGESAYDSHFSHTGTVYVASSGDSGAGAEWPAASQKVLSVGGTTLKLDSLGSRTSETAWNLSGGGDSAYVQEPSWQIGFGIVNVQSKRAIPDVSFDADPSTGVAVYDSTRYQGTYGWFEVGGTSFGSPAWAALVSLGDGYKTVSNTQELLYQLAGSSASYNLKGYFNDITSGSNGSYSASAGFDDVTGLGSPVVDLLIPNL